MNGFTRSIGRPHTRSGIVVVAVLLCALLTAGPAAAKRTVPFGFFGTVVDPSLLYSETAATVDAQYAVMAQNGIESIRTNFYWSQANPAPGVYDWTVTDRAVAAAARHGLNVLPIVEFTPLWASSKPGVHGSEQPPTDYGTFKAFMTAVVQRYGPSGSFWTEHPELKKNAIRDWQIWNEPAGDYNWRPVPWYPPYVKLLRAGHDGVKAVDPGAKIVAGAVVGLDQKRLTPWNELSDLYRQGAGKYFDVVAVNAFTNALQGQATSAVVDRNLELYKRVRAVMSRHGDAKTPIYNTEVTWTAALGKVAKKDAAGFETTASGQAQRLTAYFKRVAKDTKLRIKRVFWYTWFSAYKPVNTFGSPATFQYAGLTSHTADGQPFAKKPLLTAYAKIAAKLQGCRKTVNARICR